MNLIKVFRPDVYPPEKFDSIKLTDGLPYKMYPLISVKVTDIKKGDELDLRAEFQVTSELNYVAMIASGIRTGKTPTEVTGPVVLPNNGANFTHQNDHHYARTRTGWWRADQDYAELYFILVVYAASTAMKSGDDFTVNKHYGSMSVAQYR